ALGCQAPGRVLDQSRRARHLQCACRCDGGTLRPSALYGGSDLRQARQDMSAQGSATGRVSIVTQTRVKVEFTDAFARWQADTSKVIQSFPGFIEQTVIPPSPPQQVDWVIVQRFASEANAVAWLN